MTGRKVSDRYVVRGKTVKQWANRFGVTITAVYQWIRKGTLEARIDGTHVPSIPCRACGMTYAELRNRFGVSTGTVRRWTKDGTIGRRLAGEVIQKKPSKIAAKLIDGMDYHEIAEKLGNGKPISRQRVFQLKKKGLLRDRINGVTAEEIIARGVKRRSEELREKYRAILEKREIGESILQLARRLNVPHQSLARAAGGRVPFGDERKLLRARQVVAEAEAALRSREEELNAMEDKTFQTKGA